jgi:uncharacterized protein YndB with AHSA1/START domain
MYAPGGNPGAQAMKMDDGMKTNSLAAGASGEREFSLTRLINAPQRIVFHAWTDPKQLVEWWGPKPFNAAVPKMDFRVGGAYRWVMRADDGLEYPITGVFREIVEPERLVFTMDMREHPAAWHDMVKPDRAPGDNNPAGEILSTITFEKAGEKTLLTIRQQFETAAIRNAMVKMGMNQGWSSSLEKLDELVAAGSTADREIITTRVFDAPREMVYDAWTDPQQVAQWWGPNGFTNTIQEMDVRPGGVWRFVMHGPDGKDYNNKIVYIEVARPSRIVYLHESGPRFQMTATFEGLGGKTRLTMRMQLDSAAEREHVVKTFGAVEGAKQTLGRLAEYLARG